MRKLDDCHAKCAALMQTTSKTIQKPQNQICGVRLKKNISDVQSKRLEKQKASKIPLWASYIVIRQDFWITTLSRNIEAILIQICSPVASPLSYFHFFYTVTLVTGEDNLPCSSTFTVQSFFLYIKEMQGHWSMTFSPGAILFHAKSVPVRWNNNCFWLSNEHDIFISSVCVQS